MQHVGRFHHRARACCCCCCRWNSSLVLFMKSAHATVLVLRSRFVHIRNPPLFLVFHVLCRPPMNVDVHIVKFVKFAERLCREIREEGYWADYIDPCSGLPVSSITNAFTATCISCRRHARPPWFLASSVLWEEISHVADSRASRKLLSDAIHEPSRRHKPRSSLIVVLWYVYWRVFFRLFLDTAKIHAQV